MTIPGRTAPAGPPRLPRSRPRTADHGRARWRLADLAATLDEDLRQRLTARPVQAVLAAMADHAPGIWRLIEADPERAIRAFELDPRDHVETILRELRVSDAPTESDLIVRLQKARRDASLVVAIADLGGRMTLDAVMQALSRTADALVDTAFAWLVWKAAAAAELRLDAADPDACGMVVFGLGKLGGCELDYASAVELMVLFDQHSPAFADSGRAKGVATRMVRDLERLLGQPAPDGPALPLDLRLRPEPGARAPAVDVGAALSYYEHFGQNWERAALIKARVVAGDRTLGTAFLAELAPFLWRKYFDFAAIADIHSIMRQAGAGTQCSALGHDVRLGRGGLRDIELFVQTQQLIFGGKRPALRGAGTVPMLRRLRREGWVGAEACESLANAYAFLRRTQHRLGMVSDGHGSTPVLPDGDDALARFARFCGFASAARFTAIYEAHLRSVVQHGRLLFETAPGLGAAGGNLVFTGVANDPATLKTLAALGYVAPEQVAATVRAWHSGLRPAVRSARARERLTELVPKLLATFAKSSDPDAAVAGFDRALERLPAGAELFAILAANDALRRLFADILGSAPRLADAVATHPHLLDIAIDGATGVCCDEDAMEARVEAALAHARETEDVLDAVRDFRREEHFRIGVRLLSGELAPDDAGRAYAALATGIIRVLLQRIRTAFAAEHGTFEGSALTVLAFGRLGGREMTAGSDLDLVVVYDFDPAHARSTGAKPLEALTYFTRLTQRLISHLTVATRRGRLYDVDMRLRPSGRQGPLATKYSAFAAYQRTTAQTWEHLALTRSRAVAGDAAFGDRVEAKVASILRAAPRARLGQDVAALRALIGRERPPANAWDLKLAPGGVLELDLIAQSLVLRQVVRRPDLLGAATRTILEQAADLADEGWTAPLVAAHRLFSDTLQLVRLALPDTLTPDTAGQAFRRRLIAATGCESFGRLKSALAAAKTDVRRSFDHFASEADEGGSPPLRT